LNNALYDEDNDFGGDYPLDDAEIQENPVMLLPPIVTQEELNHLQAQATESAILQQNVHELTGPNQTLIDSQLETEHHLDQACLSLQTQALENAALVRSQEELNVHIQALTRCDATKCTKVGCSSTI
jgi:hypothetical protein